MTLDLLAVVKQAVREVLREEGFATAKPNDTGTRITLQEAADLVSVSKKTVRRWIEEGRLASYGKGHLTRVDPDEVRECLAASRRPVVGRARVEERAKEILASLGGGHG